MYKQEIQHEYAVIQKRIAKVSEHKQKIRVTEEEKEADRYVTFTFEKKNVTGTDALWYAIQSKREMPDHTFTITNHDICISNNGYLILAGLTDKNILLKYLGNLLHSQSYPFTSRYFTKEEIVNFTDKLLTDDLNIMYKPRFHFYEKFNGVGYTDYYVSQTECATDHSEYKKMHKVCQYFEPVFKINKIDNHEFITDIKLNHEGLIYSSHRMPFSDWISFMTVYIDWCI